MSKMADTMPSSDVPPPHHMESAGLGHHFCPDLLSGCEWGIHHQFFLCTQSLLPANHLYVTKESPTLISYWRKHLPFLSLTINSCSRQLLMSAPMDKNNLALILREGEKPSTPGFNAKLNPLTVLTLVRCFKAPILLTHWQNGVSVLAHC